jgi:hypothetical protein
MMPHNTMELISRQRKPVRGFGGFATADELVAVVGVGVMKL